jgi:protein arginine N-methyltransferase 1
MSLLLDEHRSYLADRPRVDALRRAVHATVRPGDIVLDLGCGSGLLGLIACDAGAARVYAIDHSGMIEIARAVARAEGRADRIVHIAGHSTAIDLPERANVLVFDQIGRLGFEAGLLEYAIDARRRLLTPDARIMPGPVALHLALAASADIRSRIEFWDTRPAGIDTSPARLTAANTGYPIEPEHVTLLSAPAHVMTLSAAGWNGESLRGRVTLTASRDARVDGLAGWFVADLAPGVQMTNAHGRADRIHRRIALLPFDPPVDLKAGESLVVSLRLLAADMILAWDTAREDGSDGRSHSTWKGMLPIGEARARTRDDAVPALTPRGLARRTVLELCDGRRPVREIERLLRERHPALFPADHDAAVFAAEVLSVYARA